MRRRKKYTIYAALLLCCVILAAHQGLYAFDSIESRFKDNQKLSYKVFTNGVFSGYIEWEYMGTQDINGRIAEGLSIDSDTKILSFLNLTSKEKVFLDSQTHLPLRVERDIVLFGSKELIEESYDQENGRVTITRTPSNKEQEVLHPDTPIQNILSLLYFFPQDIELKKGEWMTFNLPTQKVKIQFKGPRKLRLNGEEKETLFLIGRGAKRFNLWLDSKSRIPLRLEFIFLLGKVSIVKQLPPAD